MREIRFRSSFKEKWISSFCVHHMIVEIGIIKFFKLKYVLKTWLIQSQCWEGPLHKKMKLSIKDFSSKCELFTEEVFNGKHFIFCAVGKFYLTDTTNKSCGQYINKGGITSDCIIYAKPQVNWESTF